MWHYISIPKYTFALRSEKGKVVEVAPIAKWAQGKPLGEVLRYFNKQSGVVVEQFEVNDDVD